MKQYLQTAFILAAFAIGSTATWAGDAGIGPSFKGPIGLQLYSLRAQFKNDVPGTLNEVKSFGIKYAETAGSYGLKMGQFKSELLDRGITPISGHFSFEQFRDNVEMVALQAQLMGVKYAGCAWIPHKGAFNEADCRQAIETFNKAGEALAKRGIKFFYHPHGYEFEPYGKDGKKTLLDLLISETNPEYVSYEMDIFWVQFPGQDPVKLLHQYAGRWELLHLKDMKKGLATGSLSGSTDVKNDVVLGTGQLDMPGILKAAAEVGVKWYFIEDESPTSEQQIPESLKYLEKVRW